MGDRFHRLAREFRRRSSGDLYLGTKEDGGEFFIPRQWLHDTHSHFIGPTQSGKTRALELVAEQLIAAGDGCVVVIDPHDGPRPHGGLFHYLKSYCYQHAHEDRLILVDPHDGDRHGISAGFDPLRHGAKPSVQAAFGVEHIRAVCGDPAAFAATPMLARWAFNINLGLIVGELAMADGRNVVNPADAVYRRVFAEILRERYVDVAGDWEWLAGHEERALRLLDDKLGSVTNRFRNYAGIENVRWMISTRRHAIDFPEAIHERKIILANLSTGGAGGSVLIDEAQRMLGVHIIEAAIRAALNRQDPERVPVYLVIDEFQNFLTPLVLKILNETAKFGLHLILAHQFLSQLVEVAQQDFRYYHAVMANARLKVVFGGSPPEDAEKLARHLYGADLNPMEIKNLIYHTVQTSHQEWVRLVSTTEALAAHAAQARGRGRAHLESDTASSAAGSGTASGRNAVSGFAGVDSAGEVYDGLGGAPLTFSRNYANVVSGAVSNNDVASSFEMQGKAHTNADTESEFTAEMAGKTQSKGKTEGLVPVTKPDDPRPELSSVEFTQLQEQLWRHEAEIRKRPKQHAVLQHRGDYPVPFRVADVPDPDFTQDEVVPLDHEVLKQAPWAADVHVIEDEARERDAAFRQRAKALLVPTSVKKRRATKKKAD